MINPTLVVKKKKALLRLVTVVDPVKVYFYQSLSSQVKIPYPSNQKTKTMPGEVLGLGARVANYQKSHV
jgi:hypothetical protein